MVTSPAVRRSVSSNDLHEFYGFFEWIFSGKEKRSRFPNPVIERIQRESFKFNGVGKDILEMAIKRGPVFLMQLGPEEEDVSKPVNPIVFLYRFMLGAMGGMYYILVPIYMWLKDQILPEGRPIYKTWNFWPSNLLT